MKMKLRFVALALVLANLLFAPMSQAQAYQAGLCAVPVTSAGFKTCESGADVPKFNVALIGDSHTRSWFGPTKDLALKYQWKLTVISKSACPPLNPSNMPSHLPSPTCLEWNQRLQSYLSDHPAFDLIINMSSSFVTQGSPTYASSFAWAIQQMAKAGSHVIVIKDNPKPSSGFLACIAANPKNADTACARAKVAALQPIDPMPSAVVGYKNVQVADFTDSYCSATVCSPVIAGITVYRDHSHISAPWALHMQNRLDSIIPAKFKITG